MRDFIAVARALADEGRVRILLALRGRELCVCEITELLRLAPSTVSKHMSILKQADLVAGRKDGRSERAAKHLSEMFSRYEQHDKQRRRVSACSQVIAGRREKCQCRMALLANCLAVAPSQE